jgi:general stress protein YciG
MTKQEAGSKGGRATVERHGPQHMSKIGKRGAASTWGKYHLAPVGQSGWAMVDRVTNQVKTFVNFIPGR